MSRIKEKMKGKVNSSLSLQSVELGRIPKICTFSNLRSVLAFINIKLFLCVCVCGASRSGSRDTFYNLVQYNDNLIDAE